MIHVPRPRTLRRLRAIAVYAALAFFMYIAVPLRAALPEGIQSHPPMRPAPLLSNRPLGDGPIYYVDAKLGHDRQDGSLASPWRSINHAARRLQPGDTLALRGGTYYEHVVLHRSGTAEAPITIRSYPGEQAIIDGGLREFYEDPSGAWMPLEGGVEGEYVTKKSYFSIDDRAVPRQFLPGSWEPMWGKEEERPLALGHFADSMVPLHGYRLAVDLRSTNEHWLGGKNEMREEGLYAGPGLWFNRETGRVHIRLAHHRLPGLGDHAYRGETDPRKLKLVIALGFGQEVLRISGLKHVKLADLIFRGATGSPLIQIYGSQQIELDHVTAYGGFPALAINASQQIAVRQSAFRGLAAPWTSRAHMKYRGTASYQIVLQNEQPGCENIEFAHCEFTDDHDFAFFRFAKNLRFHHNLVDNFNDDGIECGAKLRDHTIYIEQNRISRCLIPLTQHEIQPDEAPLDHNPAAGVFIYRNVFDLRGGTYKSPSAEPDPTGDYLHQEGHLAGDHGGPIWPVMHVYHNTFVRKTPVFRDYFLFGLGAQGLRNTERDVFNNVFVQLDRLPGVGFAGIKEAAPLREGGNILWGLANDPAPPADPFAKFRASPMFAASRAHYEPGWTTQDRAIDPQFVSLSREPGAATHLRLKPSSPAIDSGLAIPQTWPDPLRTADAGTPDVGALPLGTGPIGVGVHGRWRIDGGPAAKAED